MIVKERILAKRALIMEYMTYIIQTTKQDFNKQRAGLLLRKGQMKILALMVMNV